VIEVEAEDLEAGTKDRKCIELFAVNVEEIVKFHSGQLAINPFIVVIVLKIKAEMIPRDQALAIKRCFQRFAINADNIVKFHSDRQAISRFFAVNVLEKEITPAPRLKRLSNPINKWK
jgi:hypothetical protein